MKGSTVRHQYACLLLGFCLVSSLPQSASASNNGPLAASLASDLVQSRAQISIFRHDDQMDVGCQSRRFVSSKIVNRPRVVNQALNERKWLERWSLDRCGQEISYDVYFTVVGEGGAYYSFREASPNHSFYARTLRLHQPRMEGGDVRALQVALLGEGLEVATDGVFGPNTRNALMAYQKKSGLTADGIAGPATSASLGL
jgi:peptidoglycan hydrolase-like protein with peptidoglycan-binding domain